MNILPVVLNIAPHEKRQAEKLVRYIKELDGTEVVIMQFDDPPGMLYPEVANWAFKQCAKAMVGKPFVWIEADSIPLKSGWLKAITEEYNRVGKPYLYVKTLNPPFDNFTGIGVQGPNAYEQAPDGFTTGGFDEWIVTHYGDIVGRTDLIQHSYGFYDSKGDATLHEFPRDIGIIRSDAVLFHKDQKQGLIDHLMPSLKSGKILNVSGVGDLGDAILSLATLKHHGGIFDYYARDNGMTKGFVARLHLVKPLIEAQPYINSVRVWKREDIDWASEGFRPKWHNSIDNLAACHARHAFDTGFIKTMPDFSKRWLTVEGDKSYAGSIVINRSARYNNDSFPWAKIVSHYGNRIIFLGTGEEHETFVRRYGKVRYRITKDMLEAAKVIAGSALFIGNQSSCMTIAEGLKHPRIQETCLWIPDCIYPPSNAQYVANGAVILPDVDGSGELVITPEIPLPDGTETPPGGWRYPGIPNGMMHPNAAIAMIQQQHPELTNAEAKRLLMEFNAKRVPEFFDKSALDSGLAKYRLAMRNNGHQI